MHRFTLLAHRAAGRHAKRTKAGKTTKGQEQLPCPVLNFLDQESGYLSQQLQLSRHNQHDGSIHKEHLPQQRECHQHCLTASLPSTHVLTFPIRSDHAPTPARHFSASAKGPGERQFRAEQPPRQALQPLQQPTGHISHRQLQQTWQQPSAYAQSGTVSAAMPQQSRPVSASAPGEPACRVSSMGLLGNPSCRMIQTQALIDKICAMVGQMCRACTAPLQVHDITGYKTL